MNQDDVRAMARKYIAEVNAQAMALRRHRWRRTATLRDWLTSDLLFFGAVTRVDRLWNWTRLHVRVSGPAHQDGVRPPPRYRFAYREWQYDSDVYAVWPLNLVLRALEFWRAHRWCLERWGTHNGLFQLADEAKTFACGRWRWPSDLPAGGMRRAPFEWHRDRQLARHPFRLPDGTWWSTYGGAPLWADNPPGGGLCS